MTGKSKLELSPSIGLTRNDRGWTFWLGVCTLVVAGISAYSDSFQGQFLFDDGPSLVENPNIRHLWPLWESMSAPRDTSGAGRPIVSLSLAICYKISGLKVWSYHAFNLAIHILAALALFGVARRALLRVTPRQKFERTASGLALAIAVLWMLHPLQTESVTYIIQRAESLVGLFYLLTLYCSIRCFDAPHSRLWRWAALVACALGMGTKEVMSTAPISVLLYDRAFRSKSFKEALRKNPILYSGLTSTWIILGALIADIPRGKSVGFGFEQMTPLDYARTQFAVILHYLRLALWPDALCFYYFWPPAKTFVQIAPAALLVMALIAASVWAYWRFPGLGFTGLWFFLILAPSSSVVPILTEVAAEHRMYLPLAAVIALAVVGIHAAVEFTARRVVASGNTQRFLRQCAAFALALGASTLLGYWTWQRNLVYHDAVTLWRDTLKKQPKNPIALNDLGMAVYQLGRIDEAIGYYLEALRLRPSHVTSRNNLGFALAEKGELDRAIEQYREALAFRPDYAEAHLNLGLALAAKGRTDEALAQFSETMRLKGESANVHNNMGVASEKMGQLDKAIEHYREALRLYPEYAEVHNNLALALEKKGAIGEAIRHLEEALRLKPDYADVHYNLGILLDEQGKAAEAIEQYSQALRLKPGNPLTLNNLGAAFAALGKLDEAITQYSAAIRAKPDYAEAHNNLGIALVKVGRLDDAIVQYTEALRIRPGYATAHGNLSAALYISGRLGDAWREIELCRRYGGTPSPSLVKQLSKKLPEARH